MKFKVGQTVVFNGDWENAAQRGATAIVVRLGDDFLYIKWVRDALSKAQGDGGYEYSKFELALQVGEQLEFSFMRED